MDAERLHTVLTAALRELRGPSVRLESWTTDAGFTEHGKRRVVRYDLRVRVDGAPHVEHEQWVGKVYDRDEDGPRVAAVLRQLARGDTGLRGGLAVPRVVAYHSPYRLLFVTYEPGESVSSAIAQDTAAVLVGMGRALAALHSTTAAVEEVLSPTVILDDLRPRVAELAARLPAEAGALWQALRNLQRAVPPLPVAPSFVHGDFGPANLLWRAGELVVLDFDKARRGDPAADLGNLLAQLRRMTVRKPEKLRDFPAARAAVLGAYQQWSRPDRTLDHRVAWYERATLLRKVHRVAIAPTPLAEETTRLLRICATHVA